MTSPLRGSPPKNRAAWSSMDWLPYSPPMPGRTWYALPASRCAFKAVERADS